MSMKIGKKPALRRFHQARWDEPVIFELSQPGQRGVLVPPVENDLQQEVGDVAAELPEILRRSRPPKLPELSHAACSASLHPSFPRKFGSRSQY